MCVCVYMFLAGSSRGMFRTLLCSCVCEFGVSWEEEPLQRWRARACPAQTKFRRTKRVGGKAFWPIAALSSQNCSGEFIGAQTPSGAIGTPGGQLSFYFYSREKRRQTILIIIMKKMRYQESILETKLKKKGRSGGTQSSRC